MASDDGNAAEEEEKDPCRLIPGLKLSIALAELSSLPSASATLLARSIVLETADIARSGSSDVTVLGSFMDASSRIDQERGS